jgi:phosphatidylglycerol:prolipoprotein diacylglycerol transferase
MPFLALSFPDIDPVIFQVGPFALRWYALAYIAGLTFGWWWLRRLVADPALWPPGSRPAPVDVDDLLVWITFGVILGGRVGYVLFYGGTEYGANPIEMLKIWRGGMSFHGGLVGAAIAMMIFARRRQLNFWNLFDLAAAAVPVGLFLGRIANFVNAELYGRPTDVPWAVVFPTGGPEPRHPSQLYEAGLEGIVLFVVLTALVYGPKLLRKPGAITGVFGIGYGLSRFFVEFFREPDPQLGTIAGGWLTMGMLLSLPLLVAGVLILAAALRGATRSRS